MIEMVERSKVTEITFRKGIQLRPIFKQELGSSVNILAIEHNNKEKCLIFKVELSVKNPLSIEKYKKTENIVVQQRNDIDNLKSEKSVMIELENIIKGKLEIMQMEIEELCHFYRIGKYIEKM